MHIGRPNGLHKRSDGASRRCRRSRVPRHWSGPTAQDCAVHSATITLPRPAPDRLAGFRIQPGADSPETLPIGPVAVADRFRSGKHRRVAIRVARCLLHVLV